MRRRAKARPLVLPTITGRRVLTKGSKIRIYDKKSEAAALPGSAKGHGAVGRSCQVAGGAEFTPPPLHLRDGQNVKGAPRGFPGAVPDLRSRQRRFLIL